MTKQSNQSRGARVPAIFAALAIAPFVFSSCGGLSKSDRETIEIPPAPVVGDTIAGTPGADAEAPRAKPSEPAEPAAPPYALETAEKYVVQNGDTLSGIASKYGVSTSDVKRANKLTDANKIRAGETLLVPGKAAETETTSPETETTPDTEETPAVAPESETTDSDATGLGLPNLSTGE